MRKKNNLETASKLSFDGLKNEIVKNGGFFMVNNVIAKKHIIGQMEKVENGFIAKLYSTNYSRSYLDNLFDTLEYPFNEETYIIVSKEIPEFEINERVDFRNFEEPVVMGIWDFDMKKPAYPVNCDSFYDCQDYPLIGCQDYTAEYMGKENVLCSGEQRPIELNIFKVLL